MYKHDFIPQNKNPKFFSLYYTSYTDMTLQSDGNDDLHSVTVEKGKDTLISTTCIRS